jgi:multidrug efflux pump subunit AcrB
MSALIGFFLRQPFLVRLIFFSVLGFGGYSMSIAQKEGFPTVDLNMVTVTTSYPGASPEDVELNVTIQLEEEISEVDGLYETSSTSQDNFSSILIKADEDAGPEAFADIVADIQQAVDQTRDLPMDLDGLPTLNVASTADRPIIVVNLFGEHEQLRRLLPLIETDIERLSGVSGVDKIGYFDREIHIEIDPVKARELRIATSDVLRAIEARNLRTTGGILESYLDEQTVVTLNKFESPQDVENVILRSSVTGQSVRVADVARVVLREKDENFIVRNEGKPGMSLVIRKKTSADIIDTIARVKDYIAGQPLLEGVGLSYSNDQSARTQLRLKVLGGNALMGFVLVVVILMLALNMRAAFWTAMSVPFSLLGAIILVSQYGITINVVSLAGFVLVLGLLVDDAIVIAEKVTHYREQGLPPLEAAQRGASEMWRPVTVASLTTILAFSPMFQLGGMPGKFAWAIPAVVILALLVSLFDSFFVLPHHLTGGPATATKGKPRWMLALERGYGWLLEHLLHWRYVVLLLMLALLGGGVFVAKNHMKFQIFPQEGVETFYLKLEMPRGASLEATEMRLETLETLIAALPENELESFSTRVGTVSTDASKNRGDHSNLGVISVFLTGEARRDRNADEIMLQLRKQIEFKENERLVFDKKRVGPATGKPIEIRVSSNDDALREKSAAKLQAFLEKQPGLYDLESDNKPGKDQLIVHIDYQRLAEVGLTVKAVAEALRVTYDGVLVSTTTSVEETLEYRVIMAPEFRGDPDMIYQIPVVNARGKVMTLEGILTLSRDRGPLEFHHINGVRTETITGDLDITVTTAQQVKRQVNKWEKQHLAQHPGVRVEMAGEAREAKKIFGGFISAGLMALIGIFLVVALLLNSLGQSLIVMSAIPFAVVGVIYAFFAHGMPLSFFSTMGTLGLIGVVVNDTILMITETNRELHGNPKGYLVRTVVQGARNRLRPVLLTTLTTVVGLLPTAYGLGGKDALIMPLTLAIAYGLMFATLITLILTPTLLTIGHDVAKVIGRGTSHVRGRAG